MSPSGDVHRMTHVWFGLATNSSSSHSLVVLLSPEPEDEVSRARMIEA